MDQAAQMPIYDYVLAQLDSTALTYKQIAVGSGVSKRTVEKVARREIEDPGVSHIQKLADFFREQQEHA
jgi:transcriptional regulator with XRE-family HTH domain